MTALTDIVRRAKTVSAKSIIAYYPNSAQIYTSGMPPSSSMRIAAEHDKNNAVGQLRSLAQREDAVFIDYTEPMQKGNDKMIVTETDGDYHPDVHGVEIMVRTVLPAIQEILGR